MFPTDKGSSVSHFVSKIIEMIRNDYPVYKLTPMGTIVETTSLKDALEIVEKSYKLLENDSDRVYVSINLDIQKNKDNRMQSKIKSIENKIGPVNQE